MMLSGKILTWKDCPPTQFVRRWETLAQCPSALLYERHPGTRSLTRADLLKLFALWFNHAKPTKSDRASILELAPCLSALNAFRAIRQPKEGDVLDTYDELTKVVGRKFSLKIFALHAALPRIFPPLCHRRLAAFRLLMGEDPLHRIPFSEALLTTYFSYQQFFFDFSVASAADIARVDRSMLAVGQFIESYGDVTR